MLDPKLLENSALKDTFINQWRVKVIEFHAQSLSLLIHVSCTWNEVNFLTDQYLLYTLGNVGFEKSLSNG